jgi:hypothetical protein
MNLVKIKQLSECIESLQKAKFKIAGSNSRCVQLEWVWAATDQDAKRLVAALDEAVYIVLQRYESELREQLVRCGYEGTKPEVNEG